MPAPEAGAETPGACGTSEDTSCCGAAPEKGGTGATAGEAGGAADGPAGGSGGESADPALTSGSTAPPALRMESETGSGGGGVGNAVVASSRASRAPGNDAPSVVALPERGCRGRAGTSTGGAWAICVAEVAYSGVPERLTTTGRCPEESLPAGVGGVGSGCAWGGGNVVAVLSGVIVACGAIEGAGGTAGAGGTGGASGAFSKAAVSGCVPCGSTASAWVAASCCSGGRTTSSGASSVVGAVAVGRQRAPRGLGKKSMANSVGVWRETTKPNSGVCVSITRACPMMRVLLTKAAPTGVLSSSTPAGIRVKGTTTPVKSIRPTVPAMPSVSPKRMLRRSRSGSFSQCISPAPAGTQKNSQTKAAQRSRSVPARLGCITKIFMQDPCGCERPAA